MKSVRMTPEEGKLSHYLKATNRFDQEINVPVIDVRDGVVERMIASQMIKSSNRSKYINMNEYHRSYKPKTTI